MKSAYSATLCDAIEIGTLQLKKNLSVDDIIAQAMQGVAKDEARRLVGDALGVAMLRAKCCPNGYPFDATPNYIAPVHTKTFDPYLFLLYGFALKRSNVANAEKLLRRFDRHFEDLVCWSLKRGGFTACVISEPREPRGLPKSLVPALAYIAGLFGEPASLDTDKIKADDNDLDVDVVATPIVLDGSRCGKLCVLMQCTTSPPDRLKVKMTEGHNLFPGVWKNGFYEATCIRGGATPEDLLTMDSLDWARLSQTGWVLDRMRLVTLFWTGKTNATKIPSDVKGLWNDLRSILGDFDWRNEWQDSDED